VHLSVSGVVTRSVDAFGPRSANTRKCRHTRRADTGAAPGSPLELVAQRRAPVEGVVVGVGGQPFRIRSAGGGGGAEGGGGGASYRSILKPDQPPAGRPVETGPVGARPRARSPSSRAAAPALRFGLAAAKGEDGERESRLAPVAPLLRPKPILRAAIARVEILRSARAAMRRTGEAARCSGTRR